jgi:hypothetical protein
MNTGLFFRLLRPIIAYRRLRAFENTAFTFDMSATYEGRVCRLISVNWPERLIGLCSEHDDTEDIFWVRAENADIHRSNVRGRSETKRI